MGSDRFNLGPNWKTDFKNIVFDGTNKDEVTEFVRANNAGTLVWIEEIGKHETQLSGLIGTIVEDRWGAPRLSGQRFRVGQHIVIRSRDVLTASDDLLP